MSAPDDVEADEDGEEPAEYQPTDDDFATPDLDALDEDALAGVAEDVAAETSAGDGDPDEQADAGESKDAATDLSIGHVYCQGLGVGAAGLVGRYDEAADRDALVDEYAALAKQMDLDDYLDQYVEQHGGATDLSPGQALVLFTLAFCASVMVANPAVAEGLAGEVGV